MNSDYDDPRWPLCEDAGFLFARAAGIFGVDAELTASPSARRDGVDWHLRLVIRGTAHNPQRGEHVDEDCLRSLENFAAFVRGVRREQYGKVTNEEDQQNEH